MKVIGKWTKSKEYIGRAAIDSYGTFGIVTSKDPFVNTRGQVRNDRPCWTVCFLTDDAPTLWYHRKQLEQILV